MAEINAGLQTLLERLARFRKPQSEKAQRLALAFAAIAFIGLGVLAAISFPDDVDLIPNWPLLLALVLVGPAATISCNAAEYMLQNRLVGSSVSFLTAARISVLGTAANLLPLPGSALVRTQSIAASGAGYKKATSSTALVGVAWLGVSALLAGPAAFVSDAKLVGLVATLAGLVLVWVSYTWVSRLCEAGSRAGVFGMILLVESATTIVGALRLLGIVVGLGLGADITEAQTLALSLAGAVAAATGILPAGLGIREALSAALASVVGLAASVGFIAAAADRIMGLLVVGLVAGALTVRKRDAEDRSAIN